MTSRQNYSGSDNTVRQYQQIDVEYNPAIRMLWTFIKPVGTPCFNLGLLEDLHQNAIEIERNGGKFFFDEVMCPVDYHVIASRDPQIFNLGGDLALFIMLIKSRDREALMHYAKLCVDCIYARAINYSSPAITISLVQGDALGGGFESALASNLIVAERSARMGFPEIIFNLFPGMGAYSLLARKVGAKVAEEMIASGNVYSAEDLHKLGVVDVLAPDSEGEKAVFDLTRQHGKRLNGLRAMYECRRHFNPISYAELMNITSLWVDASLRLQDNDLKMMSRLVRSQMRQQTLRAQGLPRNDHSGTSLAAA